MQHLLFLTKNPSVFQWKKTLNLVSVTYATQAQLERKNETQNEWAGMSQIQQRAYKYAYREFINLKQYKTTSIHLILEAPEVYLL